MVEKFKEYIETNSLFNPEDKLLVTVSGGIDSVVMLDLLVNGGWDCCVAHCNFQLRGEESDGDEIFVKELAEDYSLPFSSVNFDTGKYAQENRISIQMAARNLRYEWFEEERRRQGCEYIVLAHQKDDIIETFLINIARGTGIRGLTGIKSKVNRIVRPLLFASREEIEKYRNDNNLEYREDSSNISLKYARNIVRHNIIKEFESINPGFRKTIIENIDHLKDLEEIFDFTVSDKTEKAVSFENDIVRIRLDELKELSPLRTYLYEFLRKYNYTSDNVADIIRALDSIPGKLFYSPTHKLVRDREHLIISEIKDEEDVKYYIDDGISKIKEPVHLKISRSANTPDFIIPKDRGTVSVDYNLLEFPLILRRWQKGDYFMPFGMDQMKKVSDYFVDTKTSLTEKENTWILASGEKIVWIVGKRPDNRFRITEKTTEIIIFNLRTLP